MDVYLDNQPLATAETTLAGLLDDARNPAKEQGRLIVEVRFDGRPLSEAELESRADQPIQAETVQLVTADPRELATEVLGEVHESLGTAKDAQREAAEQFRNDEVSAALDNVRTAFQVWQEAQSAVQQINQAVGGALDAVEVDGQATPTVIGGLAEHLKTVRQQMEDRDWLALADTLDGELEQAAQTWERMLAAMRQQLDGADGS